MTVILPVLSLVCIFTLLDRRTRHPAISDRSQPGSSAKAHVVILRAKWVVPLGILGVGVGLRSLAIILAGPMAWLGLAALVRIASQRRERARQDVELLAVVDQLGYELRSGNSLSSAFGTVSEQYRSKQSTARRRGVDALRKSGRVETVLDLIAVSMNAGERLETVIERVLKEGASPISEPLRLLAVSMIVLVGSGGSASTAIERLSDTLRSRQAAADEVQAQASQATASAVVLGGLPVVFGGILAVANPKIAAFYLYSPIGALCVVAALSLIAAGWFWIDRMVWS